MQRYPEPDTDEIAGVLDRRAEALFIDGLLVIALLALVGYGGGTLLLDGAFAGIGGLYVTTTFGFLPAILLYQAGLEGYYGQTIGKRLRGIVVVQGDGSQCTWFAAIVRNLVRVVDMLPAFYIVGIAASYLIGDQKRLGDLAADTVVVHTRD